MNRPRYGFVDLEISLEEILYKIDVIKQLHEEMHLIESKIKGLNYHAQLNFNSVIKSLQEFKSESLGISLHQIKLATAILLHSEPMLEYRNEFENYFTCLSREIKLRYDLKHFENKIKIDKEQKIYQAWDQHSRQWYHFDS